MKKYLEIHEDAYKIDLALLEQYQGFSAEIARLSLALTAGLAFFLKLRPDHQLTLSERFWGISCFVCCLFAIALAIAHRYFSADGLAEYIAYLRHEESKPEQAEKEARAFKRAYKLCFWLLALSAGSFVLAALCFIFVVSLMV